MKVQELIEEKYKNFINFIQTKFPNNEEKEKLKKYMKFFCEMIEKIYC